MLVTIVVAGGPERGLGHVRRCRTLAERLRRDGAVIQFAATAAEVVELLTAAGYTARTSGSFESFVAPDGVVVVDDPAVGHERLLAIRRVSPVACLDDTAATELPVDVVVNGSIGAETLAYRGAPDTRYLLGPRYLLLRRGLADGRRTRTVSPRVERVLILCGGGAVGDLAERLVGVVSRALPQAHVDLVIGPWTAAPRIAGAGGTRVTVHRDPGDLPALMHAADLAISGGGQTAYELAAAGIPTLGLQLAADQTLNLRGLAAAGALEAIGRPDEDGLRRLTDVLGPLADDLAARTAMAAAGPRVIDGAGVDRVAEAVLALVGRSTPALAATRDA